MKPQKLVIYTHNEKEIFFISLVNEDRIDVEGRIEQQYSRARSAHKAILENKGKEVHSGFMYALINTNFSGWESTVVDEVFANIDTATEHRNSLIQILTDRGFEFVGTQKGAKTKGVYGTYKSPVNWNKKFNVNNLTKTNIVDKIKALFVGADEVLDTKTISDTYLAVVSPDRFGPKARNFGSYAVDSMAHMFLFVRNLRGYDLP